MLCDSGRVACQLRSHRIKGLREERVLAHKQQVSRRNVSSRLCVNDSPRGLGCSEHAHIDTRCRARRVEQKLAVVRKKLREEMVVRLRARVQSPPAGGPPSAETRNKPPPGLRVEQNRPIPIPRAAQRATCDNYPYRSRRDIDALELIVSGKPQ